MARGAEEGVFPSHHFFVFDISNPLFFSFRNPEVFDVPDLCPLKRIFQRGLPYPAKQKSCLIRLKPETSSCSAVTYRKMSRNCSSSFESCSLGAEGLSCCSLFLPLFYRQEDWRTSRPGCRGAVDCFMG